MACRLVALDKRLWVRPVGIGKTLRRAIANLVMITEGYQANTACGSLQLCAGLEAGIEGATHTVAKRRWERSGVRRRGRRGVRRSGGQECGKTKRGGEVRGGRESQRDRISATTARERSSEEEGGRGEYGAINKLRTAMAGM